MQKTYIDKLALIVVKDKKTLVTRSRNKDVWFTPGGKRDAFETDQQALIREIKEELSVDLLQDTIRYYGTFEAQAHGKPEGTFVKNTCYTAEYVGELTPAAEIEEIAWFSSIDREKCSLTGRLILDDLHAKGLID